MYRQTTYRRLSLRAAAATALKHPEQARDLASALAIQFQSTPELCLDAMRKMAEQIKSGPERELVARGARIRVGQES